ncbi:unnamed protein product [Ceutorhynchus assimilis]|uniref:E3 ubiquitin-protein transferase MAEA n=1 Tax=Ceutorhynchus assimilis TaxID=467358 RepID=A0A9N9MCU7_9CUCU|nr:unnamed protein product [Ceutorhynchus assimilis]
MADIKALEHPTLKVPYEILNKKFRMAQKSLDREVSHVQQSVAEVEKCLSGKEVKASEITHLLGGVEEKLQILKRKAEESIAEEMNASNVCKRRLEHLKDHSTHTGGTLTNWRRKRLDRMVIEYFLRHGFYQSAVLLAERSEMKEFTNIGWEVEKSLKDHETHKCLLWCHDNRSKLRKLKSTMEFNLRVQEFIELIRKDRRIDAIKHARKHFPGFEEEHLDTIQKVMALLAYPTDVDIVRYASLFDIRRWDDLIKQFRQENYRLFQLASQSAFTCYSEHNATRNPACPVCNEDLNSLAEPLPFAHCSQSRLYCHITGLPMNENNPPMMLPNGYIYGEQGLTQMAKENKGQVKCPKTKEVFPFKKVEKVFVM